MAFFPLGLDLVEPFGDGRLLVIPAIGPNAGVLSVVGDSNREPEAARMGYLPTQAPAGRRAATAPRPQRPGRATGHRRLAAATAPLVGDRPAPRPPSPRFSAAAELRAFKLLESLLTEVQATQWRRWRCFWVDSAQGPVRFGRLHDLRFWPADHPGEEWSVCVVPAGPPLPVGDVWSNLLLALAVAPDTFWRVANVRHRWQGQSRPYPWET